MTDLGDFLDRLDAQAHTIPHDRLIDDDVLHHAGEISLPMMRRWCERAGVALDDLRREVTERVAGPVMVVRARIDRGGDVDAELSMLAASAGLQMFLAGVLWEQDRHLPRLETTE